MKILCNFASIIEIKYCLIVKKREMKNLVLFFAVAVAVSFASCGTQTQGDAEEVVDSIAVEAEEVEVVEAVDSVVVELEEEIAEEVEEEIAE